MPSGAAVKELLIARNSFEHHRGVTRKALTIRLKTLKTFTGEQEVTSLPAVTNEDVSIRAVETTRVFAAPQPILLTEADIDDL